MIDPSQPIQAPLPSLSAPAAVDPKVDLSNPDGENHNWIWDQFGRALFGSQNTNAAGQHGGLLGDVPLVSDVLRAPGVGWRGLMDAGGYGINAAIIQPLSTAMGRIPSATSDSPYNLGDPNKAGQINLADPKLQADPRDPVSVGRAGFELAQQLNETFGQHDMAAQFLAMGQWMQKYDPTAYADWQKTLAKAQAGTNVGSTAGEDISKFIRNWSVAYADTTPEGVQGWLETHPELAFAGEGSLGQGFTDDLARVFTLQQHAEKGAAVISGQGDAQSSRGHIYYGAVDHGSRLNELLHTADANPDQLTPVEREAIQGVQSLGWSDNHAYNFLVSHGQGYSHDALTETILGMALDPVQVAALGATAPAMVAANAASYGEEAGLSAARSAIAEGRLADASKAMVRQLGTSVAAVRADPILGRMSKIARTMVDPLSSFPAAKADALKDVYSSVGLSATERGFGKPAVSDAARRASNWGVRDIFDNTFASSAMNWARKFTVARHVDNMTAAGAITARQQITEDLVTTLGENSPRDAVSRMADYIYQRREYYLTQAGQEDLAKRIATTTGKTIDETTKAVGEMSRDEQALWHDLSYRQAFNDFEAAKAAVPDPAEWGSIGKNLENLTPLNPSEMDNVLAQTLHEHVDDLLNGVGIGGKKAPKAAIKAWNEAADKFSLIENLGRVKEGGVAELQRRLNALNTIIQDGGLHTALGVDEMASLPKSFTRDFIGKWGEQWRLGFKPEAMNATGLVYDAAGELAAKYEPAIGNVVQGIAAPTRAFQPLTDAVGRMIPGKVARVGDALDVAMNVARDSVSATRVMNSMEQGFVKRMRTAGYSGRLAHDIFKVSRQYVSDHGFTIAGMGPEEFWKNGEPIMKDVIDKGVAKRDVFNMLIESAGGDMRLLGLSSGMTQRIRSGLLARGLNPNNYLGVVTSKTYSMLRYALNPTFFLQAEFDAPWFNMYRGVLFDLRGAKPMPGSRLYQMQQIAMALSHTTMSRDLAMDFTERAQTIGFTQNVVDGLRSVPNLETRLMDRVQGRLGQMVVNNELLYINSQIGNITHDAIEATRQGVLKKAAEAATPEEAAAYAEQAQHMDIEHVFDHIRENLTQTLGRPPTTEEIGRRYLAEMIDDSRMEVRTADGLLDFSEHMKKARYFDPNVTGRLEPLDIEYGAAAMGFPNVHSVADLRDAEARGAISTADMRDRLGLLGYHKSNIDRFMQTYNFNWRTYFNGLQRDLGMTKLETRGLEDMIANEAKAHGLQPADYLAQVLPLNAPKSAAKYASEGRIVQPQEMAALKAEGKALYKTMSGTTAPLSAWDAAPEAVGKDLYGKTATTEWGGATWDPRTGEYVTAEPYGYHGTMPSNMGGISAAGMRPGSHWITDQGVAKSFAFGKDAPIYRAKLGAIAGKDLTPAGSGLSKQNTVWREGAHVPPNAMEVSRDGGQTWSAVGATAPETGPWSSGIGKTTSISIADAQDPAKFQAALNDFMTKNADLLKRDGHFVGTFRDDAIGKVQFDVTVVTKTAHDTEAIQAAYGRKGGAYDFTTGNGLFAPRLQPPPALDLGLSDHMKTALDLMRAAGNGGANIDQITKLVSANLHPSMKARLLDAFTQRITGKDGLIEQAMAAGDTKAAQDLNLVLEDLRGGWGDAADRRFRDLVLKRAGGDVTSAGDVMPQPWKNDPFAKYAEKVPLADLRQFMEIDREVRPKVQGDFAHLDQLTADVKANGFKEPAILEYDPVHGLALLSDGNHRLAVAQRLGLDSMPVRVVKTTGLDKEPAAKALSDLGIDPKIKPDASGYFPADARPSDLGLSPAVDAIADPEVERAARYFSQYVQTINPHLLAGDVLKNIVDNIPVAGATPYDFTQSVLKDNLVENFRNAEKDAIRLAHIGTERTVLSRSLNHPFFAMYPTSYFWGKVIPETFRFIAHEPFGLHTGAGAEAYYHVKTSVDLQSQYDPRMKDLWDKFGKSAVTGLLSYLSPSMPWEDMKSNLPPWVRVLSKNGVDFSTMLDKELDTFDVKRWVSHFQSAANEAGPAVAHAIGLTTPQQQELQTVAATAANSASPAASGGIHGLVQGTGLKPILSNELADLQAALSR